MKEALETLGFIQSQLNAPKSQTNKFGGYNYRSCEDILEALKPLLETHQAAVTLSDDVCDINGNTYVKAIASLHANGDIVSSVGWAQEGSLKGMSPSQCTGAASSYARKYALNGLFAIDDSKDADAVNTHGKDEKPASKPKPKKQETRFEKPKTVELNKTGDWGDFEVPFGKNKGKPLSSLPEQSLQWYIDNIDDKNPKFRAALDAANQSKNSELEESKTPNKVDELPFDIEGDGDDELPF